MGFRRPAALLGLVVLVSGCSAVGGSSGDLGSAADSLVPPSSHVVLRQDGDCVELADYPSCTDVFFASGPRTESARARAVQEQAKEEGWDSRSEHVLRAGTWLQFRRGGYDASVWILDDESAARCARRPRRECADHVHVIRKG